MSGTIGYDEPHAATVRQAAWLVAAAAITAPNSGGQLFLNERHTGLSWRTIHAAAPGRAGDRHGGHREPSGISGLCPTGPGHPDEPALIKEITIRLAFELAHWQDNAGPS